MDIPSLLSDAVSRPELEKLLSKMLCERNGVPRKDEKRQVHKKKDNMEDRLVKKLRDDLREQKLLNASPGGLEEPTDLPSQLQEPVAAPALASAEENVPQILASLQHREAAGPMLPGVPGNVVENTVHFGDIVVTDVQLKRLDGKPVSVYTQDLAVMVFGSDALAECCLSGSATKASLPKEPVQDLIGREESSALQKLVSGGRPLRNRAGQTKSSILWADDARTNITTPLELPRYHRSSAHGLRTANWRTTKAGRVAGF
ncbi:hypothetical protein HPB47_014880 [Ixodes persulcatus]|uniref:Uncharacterized protein n=1 Tax=Ixodes persulcatus TaxID=34615 RepID=A0AC60QUV6_IXOPE|nr:hypothetical protein HPB47_014880 [Ixodes persulcatus]